MTDKAYDVTMHCSVAACFNVSFAIRFLSNGSAAIYKLREQ